MKRIASVIICFALICSLAACGAKEEQNTGKQRDKTVSGQAAGVTGRDVSDQDGPALKDLYADYFLMGAAINGSDRQTAAINHEGMKNVLKKHYNSTTLSNLMKPCYLLDEKGCAKKGKKSADQTEVALNFDSCRDSLEFCKENGIRMRGHTLVWHNQTPEWFFKKNYDEKKGYVSKKSNGKAYGKLH